MAKCAASTAVCALCLAPSAVFAQQAPLTAGAIYEALSFGVPLPTAPPATGLPADVRRAWLRYTTRATLFATRIPKPDGRELREVWGERIGVERVAFSLFDASTAASEAEAFVQALPFYYEAEGDIWTVLAVPDAVDAYIEAHPRTVIRDYALFLAGHRRACAIVDSELMGTPDGADQMQQARRDLLLASRSTHPLLRLVASLELREGCAR